MAFTTRTKLTLGHNSYHQEKTLKRPANQPFNNRDMDCSIIDKQFKQRDKQFTNRDKSFNNWEKSFTIRDRLFKGAKHLSSVRNSARSHAATLPITSNNYCCKCKNTQKVRTCPNHPPNFLSDKCSEPTHPFQRLKPNTLSE